MTEWDELIIQQVVAASGPGINDLLCAGDAMFVKGDYQRALFHYMAAVRLGPDVAEHHYRMGAACVRLGQMDAARFSFEETILRDPNNANAYCELSRVLLLDGKVDQAFHHARRAAQLMPKDPNIAVWLASVLEEKRDFDGAMAIVDRLLSEGHETIAVAFQFARLAGRRKREGEALDLVGNILGRGKFSRPRDESSLHFVAATLLDRMGRYDEAFDHAAKGNASRGAKYDADAGEKQLREWKAYFTPAKLKRLSRATNVSQTPVFIIGLPRSGTTLLEQIIASHPQGHGAGELDWISKRWESALHKYEGGKLSLTQCLDRLTVNDVNELASEYLAPLQALNPTARRITDKMPANVMHVGLIAMLFPKARIIDCRRNPLDSCLSCYMTDFALGNEFSFNLTSCGQAYRLYSRMMDHWKSSLDLSFLEVEYEQVVSDLEGQTRRMLDFLDLPWDERCLAFHENQRFVNTTSQAQVRQPIYRQSIDRWKHYDKHLGPLRAALLDS